MEVVITSDASLSIYQTTQCNIPEDNNLSELHVMDIDDDDNDVDGVRLCL
jgi:hypothetical protein